MHWRRKWQPTPVFLPGESQDGGAWWAAVYGVAQSRTRLKQLCSSSSSTAKGKGSQGSLHVRENLLEHSEERPQYLGSISGPPQVTYFSDWSGRNKAQCCKLYKVLVQRGWVKEEGKKEDNNDKSIPTV